MQRAPGEESAAVERAVLAAAGSGVGTPKLVLAVSGGRDSMVMLHAFARAAPGSVVAVATFDHRTGPHASEAVRLVAECCAELGLRTITGAAAASQGNEAAWRADRWRFLRSAARDHAATVATAHTRDDNIETVLIRALRGSGARGLAALYAASDVARPLVELSRDAIARYAVDHHVRWIEDPSNAARAFLRNRVRHDLLPALTRAHPSIGDDLLDIARRAAAIRDAFDDVARTLVAGPASDGSLVVATAPLGDYDPEELCSLWPAIAARGQIVLDRRGTDGLARFTKESTAGDRLQLSGAIDVLRRREQIVLRRTPTASPEPTPLGDSLEWGGWRFRVANRAGVPGDSAGNDAWSATFPRTSRLTVRAWQDGDRMHGSGDVAPRRVKRFLRDAGLVGPERHGWPVVVWGAQVVWIPGVRRSDAATVRSGRLEAVYVCERTER